jgi:hypothetical protein
VLCHELDGIRASTSYLSPEYLDSLYYAPCGNVAKLGNRFTDTSTLVVNCAILFSESTHRFFLRIGLH